MPVYSLDILSTILFLLGVGLLLWLGWTRSLTWASALFIFAGWILLFIGIDAVYTLYQGSFGPSPVDEHQTPLAPRQVTRGLLAWGMGVAAFVTGYFLVHGHHRGDGIDRQGRPPVDTRPTHTDPRHGPVLYLLALAAVLLSLVLGLRPIWLALLDPEMSLGRAISLRNRWFADSAGLNLLLINLGRYAVLTTVFLVLGTAAFRWRPLVLLVIAVIGIDLLAGMRSGLLFGFFLPAGIAVHLLWRRLRLTHVAVAAIILALLVGVIYRTYARDAYYRAHTGRPTVEVLAENLADIPRFIWGGYEAASFDASIDILHRYADSEPYLYGRSIRNALLVWIPRDIWTSKPLGGGNTEYTRRFYPEMYAHDQTEYSASFVGDLYMNFGFPAVVGGFFVLGLGAGAAQRWLLMNPAMGRVGVLLYAALISRMFSLLRGDMFNFMSEVARLLAVIGVVLLIYWLVMRLLERRRPPPAVGEQAELEDAPAERPNFSSVGSGQ